MTNEDNSQSTDNNNVHFDMRIHSDIRKKHEHSILTISDINTDVLTDTNSNNNRYYLYKKKTYPLIHIHELQASAMFIFQQKIKRTIKSLKAAGSRISQIVTSVSNVISNTGEKDKEGGPEQMLNDFVAELGTPYNRSDIDAQFKESFDDIDFALNGLYIRSYEIPYNKTSQFIVNSNTGWTAGEGRYFDSLFKMVESYLGIDSIAYPEFKMSSDTGKLVIATNFILINNTFDNLQKNVKFIHLLYPGALWGRVGYKAAPSNVYSIDIPGVNFLRFCTIDLKIVGKGYQKKLSENLLQKLKTSLGLSEKDSGFINKDTFFPEIYDINVSFTSLMPYTFELYAQYLNDKQGYSTTNVKQYHELKGTTKQ